MIQQEYGVTFGGLHSWRDMGLAFKERQEIGSPDPELFLYEVPGRNGPLDCSEALTGRVTYKQRTLQFDFVMRETARYWPNRYSKIMNALHGQRMKIVCDDDPYFYYEGRVMVEPVKSSKYMGTITITADVDPYKYERFSSVEPWLWNPFNFEFGVIREYGRLKEDGSLDADNSIAVNGTGVQGTTLTVIGSNMPVVPTFYAKSTDGNGITVTYNGTDYPLFFVDSTHTVAGHNVIEGPQIAPVTVSGAVEFNWRTGGIRYPAIELLDGEYKMVFSGVGHVALEYRGGIL